MKKIILCLICLTLVIGCKKEEHKEEPKPIDPPMVEEELPPVEEYIDDNPIVLGLYIKINGRRYLSETYESSLPIYTDINGFTTFYTNEKEISGGRLKDVWHSKYQNYTDISGYKIGYHLKFETVDGVVERTILKPSDGDYVYKYIQVYLYDDVNQEASFYSHIEDKDMTENTMLTTIKLFTSTKIADVISPIELTVFTYNGEEDFKDGMYRGNSKFTTIIKKK